MKVLISWSGELSQRVALLLREWLPMFIQVAEPWVSSEDIDRGTLWRTELANELAQGSTGILCVTRDNVASPWVNFEAGALSKTPETARVIPFLFEMRPSDIYGPLAGLMGAIYERGSAKNKEEFRKLLGSLNTSRNPPYVAAEVFNATFDRMWPEFEPRLDALAAEAEKLTSDPVPNPPEVSDVLEEVLQAVRDQSRMIGNALGDRRWTFRGNAQLDPLSRADYRQIALGLGMLKTLAEIEEKDYYRPPGSTVKTLLMLRDPLEVLLGRAHAPLIHSVYFTDNPQDPDGPWTVTYSEDELQVQPWDRTTLTEDAFTEALEADRSTEQDAQAPVDLIPAPAENAQGAQESPEK